MLPLAFLFVACEGSAVQPNILLESPNGESRSVAIEIADEPDEWSQGLMHRTSLADGTGMLFLFPEEKQRSFWMKNTLIPLDILYFDSEGNMVSLHTMTPCKGDPCPTYGSKGAARYALEVPAGYAKREGITTGWRLRPPVSGE